MANQTAEEKAAAKAAAEQEKAAAQAQEAQVAAEQAAQEAQAEAERLNQEAQAAAQAAAVAMAQFGPVDPTTGQPLQASQEATPGLVSGNALGQVGGDANAGDPDKG